MSNNLWLAQTVTRSTSVVPVHGFGMGDVCPQAAGYTTGFLGGSAAVTPMRKRHADAVQATWVSARQPWSPPVT